MRADLVRDLSDMRRIVETGSTRVFDARPAARFKGEAPEPRPGLRSGHMPGAQSVPAASLIARDGTLKSDKELAAIFQDAGVEAASAAVCTCGSGITAAIIALALARLGRWDAAVYDGSWAEWGGLADTPVATAQG
jgi:thiosulfate/3-mercaptopyruvate sulfurtransferase